MRTLETLFVMIVMLTLAFVGCAADTPTGRGRAKIIARSQQELVSSGAVIPDMTTAFWNVASNGCTYGYPGGYPGPGEMKCVVDITASPYVRERVYFTVMQHETNGEGYAQWGLVGINEGGEYPHLNISYEVFTLFNDGTYDASCKAFDYDGGYYRLAYQSGFGPEGIVTPVSAPDCY